MLTCTAVSVTVYYSVGILREMVLCATVKFNFFYREVCDGGKC